MDEQQQDLFNGIVALILIIDTIAVFSLALGMPLQGSSQNQVNPILTSETVPVRTTPPLVKTPEPVSTPVPALEGYVTIFNMKNYDLDTSVPPIFFNLVNPPLIISYNAIPLNVTDIEEIDYKTMSTYHHDVINITRPYEEAFFKVRVISSDGVVEEGFGKGFEFKPANTLVVKKSGNVTIGIAGAYVNVTLSVKVPKEGNMP